MTTTRPTRLVTVTWSRGAQVVGNQVVGNQIVGNQATGDFVLSADGPVGELAAVLAELLDIQA